MGSAPLKDCGLLEVIACSVTDALEAEKGGANRLEVVGDMDRGGLTPRAALVRHIRAVVPLPIRVILRESESYSVSSRQEMERLCETAQEFSEIGVDGAVLGFLRRGAIDRESVMRLLSFTHGLKATFHHAFDEIADPHRAIDELKDCTNVDHILTRGGVGGWPEKARQLNLCQQRASPEITILAGGGLDENAIRLLRGQTGIREFHVGRAVRVPARADGTVQAALVRRLVQILQSTEKEKTQQ